VTANPAFNPSHPFKNPVAFEQPPEYACSVAGPQDAILAGYGGANCPMLRDAAHPPATLPICRPHPLRDRLAFFPPQNYICSRGRDHRTLYWQDHGGEIRPVLRDAAHPPGHTSDQAAALCTTPHCAASKSLCLTNQPHHKNLTKSNFPLASCPPCAYIPLAPTRARQKGPERK
jgi:hypothetical protein